VNHIVDSLIRAGFDKQFVRKHRVFGRAAVIAKAADAAETLIVSPPLEDEEEYWTVQVYRLAPTTIRDNLPDDHMIVWDKRPKSFWEIKKIVFDFLK
jgi:hypothetical protein